MTQRFEVGRLLRALNLLDQSMFAVAQLGPTAVIQSRESRIALRGEFVEIAKHLKDLGALQSVAALLDVLSIVFDDTKPFEFATLDPVVQKFRLALIIELGSMQFCKVELKLVEPDALAG